MLAVGGRTAATPVLKLQTPEKRNTAHFRPLFAQRENSQHSGEDVCRTGHVLPCQVSRMCFCWLACFPPPRSSSLAGMHKRMLSLWGDCGNLLTQTPPTHPILLSCPRNATSPKALLETSALQDQSHHVHFPLHLKVQAHCTGKESSASKASGRTVPPLHSPMKK